MQEKKSRINIIGGSGFVGTRLVTELGVSNCFIFDKKLSPYYPSITTIGDIRNSTEIKLAKGKEHIVILLAAEHKDDVSPSSLYYNVNVEGTKNVLKKMDEYGIKQLVFTSSVAVYGLNKENPDENHTHDPFNHYGKSKWEAEKVIKEWYEGSPEGKSVTIIRPTVIFGERNRGNVYNLLRQISSGKFLMIGNGENRKSMAYVGNVVAFIKHRIEKNEPGCHVFNYVDKPDLTMYQLTRVIEEKMSLKISNLKIPYWLGMLGGYGFDVLAKLTGKKFSISSVRVKKFCASTQFNATKAYEDFKAPFSLNDGIKRTLEYEFLNSKNEKDDVLFYSE